MSCVCIASTMPPPSEMVGGRAVRRVWVVRAPPPRVSEIRDMAVGGLKLFLRRALAPAPLASAAAGGVFGAVISVVVNNALIEISITPFCEHATTSVHTRRLKRPPPTVPKRQLRPSSASCSYCWVG